MHGRDANRSTPNSSKIADRSPREELPLRKVRTPLVRYDESVIAALPRASGRVELCYFMLLAARVARRG